MECVEKKHKAKGSSESQTPNKFPSYVVAFSLKETYDDLITAQQMICNKKSPQERSPQESTNSITPTNSLKMFETEQADKLNQILDKSGTETNEETDKNDPYDSVTSSTISMAPNNYLQYLSSSDTISDASTITIKEKVNTVNDLSEDVLKNNTIENTVSQECGEVNENAVKFKNNTLDEDNKSYENVQVHENAIKNSISCEIDELTDKTDEKVKYFVAKNKNGNTKVEPEAIFVAKGDSRKTKIIKRKPRNSVHIKQKNFKYKNPNKAIDAGLAKFYEKKNYINTDQTHKELYSDEVSTVVSRTRVLHKITAKENLLEESEFITFINDVGLNSDSESLSSSLSTAKKSMVSKSSQITLTEKASKSSRNKDELNFDSVKNISKENIPYKTDIINVSVAVAYKRPNLKTKDKTLTEVPSKEKLLNLTSSETVIPQLLCNITSDPPSIFENLTSETSVDTLVNKKSSDGVIGDGFFIARTSSNFTGYSDESTCTLKNKKETVVDIELESIDSTMKENKSNLVETSINLDTIKMTPSTSLDTPYEYALKDDVIVTKNLKDQYQVNSNKFVSKKQEISHNILNKNYKKEKKTIINKTINLPNQAEIKALLNKNEMPQMKCAEEARHPSYYMPEIWDRLIMTLDLAVKKLEENLAKTIVKDLKKFLVDYTLSKDLPVSESLIDVEENKREVAEELKLDVEQGFQCDLISNTILDKVMQKVSTDGPAVIDPGIAVKCLREPELFKDFEVLKSPEVSHQIMPRKGDAVIVSPVTGEVREDSLLNKFISDALCFLRENVFVLCSAPTFVIGMMCLYILFLFLII